MHSIVVTSWWQATQYRKVNKESWTIFLPSEKEALQYIKQETLLCECVCATVCVCVCECPQVMAIFCKCSFRLTKKAEINCSKFYSDWKISNVSGHLQRPGYFTFRQPLFSFNEDFHWNPVFYDFHDFLFPTDWNSYFRSGGPVS